MFDREIWRIDSVIERLLDATLRRQIVNRRLAQ
jgi:hypothetical protein